jgi:hypothetical protein
VTGFNAARFGGVAPRQAAKRRRGRRGSTARRRQAALARPRFSLGRLNSPGQHHVAGTRASAGAGSDGPAAESAASRKPPPSPPLPRPAPRSSSGAVSSVPQRNRSAADIYSAAVHDRREAAERDNASHLQKRVLQMERRAVASTSRAVLTVSTADNPTPIQQ